MRGGGRSGTSPGLGCGLSNTIVGIVKKETGQPAEKPWEVCPVLSCTWEVGGRSKCSFENMPRAAKQGLDCKRSSHCTLLGDSLKDLNLLGFIYAVLGWEAEPINS